MPQIITLDPITYQKLFNMAQYNTQNNTIQDTHVNLDGQHITCHLSYNHLVITNINGHNVNQVIHKQNLSYAQA